MTLRIAIGWSVLAHLGLLTIHPPVGTVPPLRALRSIEVTYQGDASLRDTLSKKPTSHPETSGEILRDSRAQAVRGARPGEMPDRRAGELVPARVRGAEPRTVRHDEAPFSQAPAPRVDLTPVPAPSSTLLAAPGRVVALPTAPAAAPGRVVALPTAPAASPEKSRALPRDSPSGAVALPEEAYASVSYRQEVRRHLKRHLKYPSLRVQGTVRLRLALDANGFLKEATLLESSDSFVAKTALEGVRAAQPYPRFPKELEDVPQVSYEFLIQYQWE